MQKNGDDTLTVSAIAILAASIATFAHEGVGHGGACLLLGGTITRLTTVYFECSAHDTWIAAAGPLGNLIAGALAWLGVMLLPAAMARTRLLFFLISVISLFWFAGYLIYSAAMNVGDTYFVLRDLFGEPGPALRAGEVAIGASCYWIAIQAARTYTATSDAARARRRLTRSWLAASLSACVAALAYAPGRLAALGQAALEIGAACLPMLARVAVGSMLVGQTEVPIARSWGWIAASLLGFTVFAATLGRGMP